MIVIGGLIVVLQCLLDSHSPVFSPGFVGLEIRLDILSVVLLIGKAALDVGQLMSVEEDGRICTLN
jgi:hypothetical protein